jgi:DMSO/TMAO reductase YedYZ molybdopterin-dependent catalytic subunit
MTPDPGAPLPPNQIVTTRWPTIGEREPEPYDAATWRLDVAGLVATPLSLSRTDLDALPHVVRSGTIHCVTRWSRPGTAFRGVRVGDLLDRAGLARGARFVRFASGRGHDTSLPLDVACDDVIVADAVSLDGSPDGPFAPIPPANGGPVRTVTFARYFYKSVKWVRRIEALAEDSLGFWERTAGYHNGADPWREQRYVAASPRATSPGWTSGPPTSRGSTSRARTCAGRRCATRTSRARGSAARISPAPTARTRTSAAPTCATRGSTDSTSTEPTSGARTSAARAGSRRRSR